MGVSGVDGLWFFVILAVVFGPFVIGGMAVGWFMRGRKEARTVEMAMDEARRLVALVEQIRHDAYEHMTLDSALAPIIVDTIRASDLERKRAEQAAGVKPQLYLDSPAQQPRPFIQVNPPREPDEG